MPSFFLCPWAWLMILPCHYTTPAMISLLFYFVITPGLTSWGSYQSISYILSSFGLYWLTFLLDEPTFHIITSFKLLLGHVLAMLAHPIPWASLAYFISWAFSAHFFSLPLLLLWAFAKSFRLPRPNYYILTSYYLSGLLAFMPTLWIY